MKKNFLNPVLSISMIANCETIATSGENLNISNDPKYNVQEAIGAPARTTNVTVPFPKVMRN